MGFRCEPWICSVLLQMNRAAGSPWAWTCAELREGSSTWKERPGTWTNARSAPAGRGGSCVTLRCVPQPSAHHRPSPRGPAVTPAQVNGGVDRKTPFLGSQTVRMTTRDLPWRAGARGSGSREVLKPTSSDLLSACGRRGLRVFLRALY